MRAAYIIGCAIIAAIAAYFGAPLVHKNTDATTVMITMFTVFAGFLVAVMVILGDPVLLPAGTWRDAESHRENLDRRLIRHMSFFNLYLITIGLIFAGTLFKEAEAGSWLAAIGVWIERAYFGFAVFAFLLTLALPKMVTDVQRQRMDGEIERRRGGALNGRP